MDTIIFVRRLCKTQVIVCLYILIHIIVKKSTMLIISFLYNCRSLQYGNQFIYQSMPRMLSLWLDFGAKAYEWEKGIIYVKILTDKRNFDFDIKSHLAQESTYKK